MTTAVWADVPDFKGGAQVNLRLQHIRTCVGQARVMSSPTRGHSQRNSPPHV